MAEELPAEELFPLHSLAEAATSVLSEDPLALQYGEAEGYGPLREWLSEDFSRRKGLSVQPQHILLTTGTQQAIDLLVRVYVDPGDPVLVENPTSPDCFRCCVFKVPSSFLWREIMTGCCPSIWRP